MHAQHLLIHTRRLSSATPFPFPKHSHPTPHQIFHLPSNASQKEIKSRYYDLVRSHHPDSPHCRHLDPALRHSRFQAITSAYDDLTGKRGSRTGCGSNDDALRAELRRRRRHQEARREYEYTVFGNDVHGFGRPRAEWNASPDDRWKDWAIICIGIVSLGAGLMPLSLWTAKSYSDATHQAASANLAAARRDAREFGTERREQIRQRVQEFKGQDQGGSSE
ncbi:hypothetical protein BXZ70DRAFT_952958 [Cristinia sonorae]|uniref:J domain-containing protein n=1 Tax=Cristinia sonorae TaxID=1940300 RepID=A0A8K0XM98_9AGAR|nr:hypothetical protein BXZ70DRAFT_952958 [Cristinia sonorae]